MGADEISEQFIKIISQCKNIGYGIGVLRQTACFDVNPVTVGSLVFLFNCTPAGRTSSVPTWHLVCEWKGLGLV